MTQGGAHPVTILLVSGALSQALLAADYFVAGSGDDHAAGTAPDSAWRSVTRVNAQTYRPGDRILFAAGQSFGGNLHLGPESSGQSNAPVVVSSFGEGRAQLLAGTGTGITVESAGGVTISNLIVAGNGPTNNSGYGILFDNRLDGFKRLENVRIADVEVSGFGVFGILVTGREAGYHHVRITDCDLHHNLRGGMEIAGRLPWNSPRYAHRDVIVSRCQAHENSGDPNYNRNHSGSGMVVYQVDGGLIEDCRAWDNGRLCPHGNGGVGIWTCASRAVVIERCESFANRTNGGDGGGFDLDGGSIDCVLQYNYSHDNDGPGLMAYTYAYASHADRGNIIRFNISDQDSRKGTRYAGLWVRNDGNGMTGLKVYNNTILMGAWSKAAYVHGQGVEAEFRNNIFAGLGGALPLLVEQPGNQLRFSHNLYWAGGAPFRVQWSDRSYASLEEWRHATGQELAEGKLLGIFEDPRFTLGSAGSSPSPENWRTRLAIYRPKLSPASTSHGPLLTADLTHSRDRMDILGASLAAERWPLGAIEFGP